MTWPFLRGFALAFLAAAALFAGLAALTRAMLFQPPPERYYTRGFSFEYPAGWLCIEAQAEVDCHSPEKVNDSILIVSTKTLDARDTMEIYRDKLSHPMENAYLSELHPVMLSHGDVTLGGQLWTEGTQHESEVRGYDTRYLATITGATAVLLTFSCHQSVCGKMQPEIDRVAASLRVVGATSAR